MLQLIGTPRSGGRFGNICAFCHFWEGETNFKLYKINSVLYDDVRGICLAWAGSSYASSTPACPKFQMGVQASRYCKL